MRRAQAIKVAAPERPLPINGDRAAASAYIAAMTTELAALARRHNLDVLQHLLEMAHLEAEGGAHRMDGASPG